MAKLTSTDIYGSLLVQGTLLSNSTLTGTRLISTVANGTAPLTVASTTVVSNLNADLLDGQEGSYYLNYNNFTNTPTIGNAGLALEASSTAGSTNTTVTVETGTGFTANATSASTYKYRVGPALTALATTMTGATTGFLKKTAADTYTLDTNTYLTAHPAVSAAASSNNSGRTYIQDVLLDSFGHVTGLATATETVTDTNTTYSVSTEAGANIYEEIIRLTAGGSGSGTDDVILAVGPTGTSNTYGLTIAESGETITFAHADTSTQASVNNSGRTYIQDVTLDEFGHVTGLVSATETVTDTTYSEISEAEIDSTTDSNGRLVTGRRANYLLRNNVTATTTANLATGITANTATKTVNLGTGGASGSTTNINIGSSVAGTTTINSTSTITSGSLTVGGDLLVNGSLTTINSTTMTVDDPIITLGGDTAPSADDSKDRGIEFRYFDTAARLGFFGYDRSIDSFTGFRQATNTSEVFSGTLMDARFNSFVGSLGAVGTPAFTFTGDTNTGIWSSGADTLNISTAGAERLRVTSAGNLGIGTDAPDSFIHMKRSSTDVDLKIENNQTSGAANLYLSAEANGNSSIRFERNSDSLQRGKITYDFGTDSLNFRTASTDNRLVITSAGNVGIGTTAPFRTFHVAGASAILRVGPNYTEGGDRDFVDIVADGSNTQINSTNETFTINNAGGVLSLNPSGYAVGIGTATPLNKLEVRITGADSSDGIMITRSDATTTTNEILGGIGFDSTDGNVPSSILEASAYIAAFAAEDHSVDDKGGYLTFGTAPIDQDDDTVSTERMRITASGNVGIGDTNPSDVLTVNGRIRVNSTNTLSFGTSQGGHADIGITGASTGTIVVRNYNGTNFIERMRITHDTGNFGINEATPTAQLHVKSGATNRVPLIVDTLSGQTENLQEWKNNGSLQARITTSGYLLTSGVANIGTPSNSRIDLNSTNTTISRDIADSNAALIVNQIHASSTGDILKVQAAGTDRLTVARAGNVGIGTTSPAQRLEVVGNTKTQNLIISDTSNVAKATMTYDSTSKSVKFVFA